MFPLRKLPVEHPIKPTAGLLGTPQNEPLTRQAPNPRVSSSIPADRLCFLAGDAASCVSTIGTRFQPGSDAAPGKYCSSTALAVTSVTAAAKSVPPPRHLR